MRTSAWDAERRYRDRVADEEDVRRAALALPEVTEEPFYGAPGYKVRGKGFLRFRTEAEGALVIMVADLGEKEALINADPETFFSTAHYDDHASVLARIEHLTADELAELVTEAWRCKAPARLRKEFDAAR